MSSVSERRVRLERMAMNAVVDRGITMKNGWPVKPVITLAPAPPKISGMAVRARFQLILQYPKFPEAATVLLKRHSIDQVIKVVCQHYDITRNDLLSHRRHARIVNPRQIAMYLAKLTTPKSLPEIGRRMGNRDHTTVLHAVRKYEALRKEDADLDQEIEGLRMRIEVDDGLELVL